MDKREINREAKKVLAKTIHKRFVGKIIKRHATTECIERTGIITDAVKDALTFNTQLVILWDTDEEQTVDMNGKVQYDYSHPVSTIDLDRIIDTRFYEVLK